MRTTKCEEAEAKGLCEAICVAHNVESRDADSIQSHVKEYCANMTRSAISSSFFVSSVVIGVGLLPEVSGMPRESRWVLLLVLFWCGANLLYWFFGSREVNDVAVSRRMGDSLRAGFVVLWLVGVGVKLFI